MFTFTFYIFSLLLSYFDCKRFIVPNVILATCFLLILFFGYFEDRLNIYSFIVSFLVLLFFILIMMIKPKMILGGGDIKYMMLVAVYLNPLLFPLFLLTTGIVQTIFLVYKQYYKKRRVAPMVPAMFISVVVVELLFTFGIYP